MTDEISFHAYAPPLTDGDPRALALVHGMERAFPYARLAWKLVEEGRPVALPERDRWLIEHTRAGKFPLLCNGDETYPVTISTLALGEYTGPGGHPATNIHALLPLDEKVAMAAAGILGGIGDGAQAFWGVASPGRTSVEIAEQFMHPMTSPDHVPPRGLPGLYQRKVTSPVIPDRAGWLNYWSLATAEALGFPDPSRDAELLAMARLTAGGAWIVRLSEEPLDLNIPAHLEALRRLYDQFPAIGGRSTPAPASTR